jgi:hypothetical protein
LSLGSFGVVWEDMSSQRGEGWMRLTCDVRGCGTTIEARAAGGSRWPEGWADDLRHMPMTAGSVSNYCPVHAHLATDA